ncbi:pyruvate-binding protein [Pseudomonadota bacterium]
MNIGNRRSALAILAVGMFGLASSPAIATPGAVITTSFDGGDNDVAAGETITASNISGASSSYKSPVRDYSAAGDVGHWFTFETLSALDVTVNASASGDFSPGLTVWASGNSQFNGGSTVIGTEISGSGHVSPGSFNATSAIGAPGTSWMASGSGGNLIETLGYAVSGPNHTTGFGGGFGGGGIGVCLGSGCPTTGPTGWGENIFHGAHDVSLTNNFENGVGGSVSPVAGFDPFGFGSGGDQFAELTFNNLQPGWYAVFVGGTDNLQSGALYDLTISAVPEMETWAMMLAGMGFLGWRANRQRQQAASAGSRACGLAR